MVLDSTPVVTTPYNLALAYNDPNTDGAVTIQREVGDNLIVLTIFAMQIWYPHLYIHMYTKYPHQLSISRPKRVSVMGGSYNSTSYFIYSTGSELSSISYDTSSQFFSRTGG